MTSNTVEVEVLIPNFTVKKEQRIKGEATYTTAKLKAEVGATIEYKITVSNTGGTTLKFGALKDAKCTNIQPAGETSLKAGESESFTCEHVLVEADSPIYTNVATIEGGGKEKETPPVEVEVENTRVSRSTRNSGLLVKLGSRRRNWFLNLGRRSNTRSWSRTLGTRL